MKLRKQITKAYTAGFAIGIAAITYMLNPGVLGSFLFAMGLFTCITLSLHLFTGKIGAYKPNKKNIMENFKWFGLMLLFNVIGIASVVGIYYFYTLPFTAAMMYETAIKIVGARWYGTSMSLLLGSIGCGILMSTAVDLPNRVSPEKRISDMKLMHYIPLFLCVPMFILNGFPHCIADIAYYTIFLLNNFSISNFIHIFVIWLHCVFGNIIGCMLGGWVAKEVKQN